MTKLIIYTLLSLSLIGCEKKQEEVEPTETKTTIIEVENNGNNEKSEDNSKDGQDLSEDDL